nr:MAG TPA: hypothetical protein [Caudoviricetes sp.]
MTYGYISTHHRTIFILMNLLMNNLQCVYFLHNFHCIQGSHLLSFCHIL